LIGKSPKPALSVAFLVAANIAPLAGVLWFGWDAATIILVYWTENLVIGFYNILRIAFLRADCLFGQVSKLLAMPFFTLHFGGFCAVHGLFLTMLLAGHNTPDLGSPGGEWPGPLVFLQLLVRVVSAMWKARPDGAGWIVASLAVSHGLSFVYNYIVRGEYARTTVGELMARPYKRIVLLHVALLAGGVPIMMAGSPAPLLVILVLLKIGGDVLLHVRSHRSRA